MVWLKLTSKALYLMDEDEYLEKMDLVLQRATPEQYKTDLPLDWLRGSDAAGQIIIALESSTEPEKKAVLPPPPNTRRFISITKTGSRDANGLEALNVSLMQGNTQIDRVFAISGQPGRQAFRLPAASRAGSMEPLPEGFWDLGMPKPNPQTRSRSSISKLVEWASGVTGNTSANWPDRNDGLGPVWVEMTCRSWTARSDIGFHVDNNSAPFPGTVGCIGITRDAGLKSLKKFASWFDDSKLAPHVAVVDWGLGTV